MPPARNRLRNFAIHSLARSRVARIFARRFAGLGSIFVMHRVVPAEEEILTPHHCVSSAFLEEVLDYVRRRGWDALALDDVEERLRSRARTRFVCFTFDDGYRDNIELAQPLLGAFDVPATLYACVSLADHSGRYWWGALAELIATNDRIDLTFDGLAPTLELGCVQQKRAVFRRIARLVRARPECLPALTSVFAEYGVDEQGLMRARFLDWKELRAAARLPGIEIGSHTLTHRSLSELTEEDAREELVGSKELLEERLGAEVRHLAYPYGLPANCGTREFALARAAGFATAATTRQGNLFAEHVAHLTALPRIPINAAMQGLGHFELHESGTISALQHRFARVVTD